MRYQQSATSIPGFARADVTNRTAALNLRNGGPGGEIFANRAMALYIW
jgi:hypothetical protein